MSTLLVLGFDDAQQADEVRLRLLRLQREHLVDLEDAAVVIRDDKGHIKLRQLVNLTAGGATAGGFWGALIGLIFLNPLLGLAAGATAGAIAGALSDVGVNDDFMRELGATLQPGTSALCILVRRASVDKVIAELSPFSGQLLRTSLAHEDEDRLKEILMKAGPTAG